MKKRCLAILVGIMLAGLQTPVAFAEDPPQPPAGVKTPEGKWNKTRVEADHQADDQPRTARPSANAPASYPQTWTTIAPGCDAATYTDIGSGNSACTGTQCKDGELFYVRTTWRQDSAAQPPIETDAEPIGCQNPGAAASPPPAELAIHEFYETTITIDPPQTQPGTTTLCNLPTVFYSTAKAYEHDTAITVAKVRLKFTPIKYTWTYGDGETDITTYSGKPLNIQDLTPLEIEEKADIAHAYPTKGQVQVSLTIAFHGEYSINGEGWQPINGTNWATSPATTLTIKEARAELVDPNAPLD